MLSYVRSPAFMPAGVAIAALFLTCCIADRPLGPAVGVSSTAGRSLDVLVRECDQGVRGFAPVEASSDEKLVLDPAELTLVPGSMACLQLSFVTADGTRRPAGASAGSVGVTVGDSEILNPAGGLGCPAGLLPLAGVAAGSTDAAICMKTVAGRTVTATGHFEVLPYELRLEALPLTLRVGGQAEVPFSVGVYDAGGERVEWTGSDLYVPAQALQVDVDNPDLVSAVVPGDRWGLEGHEVGTALYTITYGQDSIRSTSSASVRVTE
jgi:hypothetical protein